MKGIFLERDGNIVEAVKGYYNLETLNPETNEIETQLKTIKRGYVSVLTDIHTYGDVTYSLSAENVEKFFDVDSVTSDWKEFIIETAEVDGVSGIKLIPSNLGMEDTSSAIILDANINLTNIKIYRKMATRSGVDYLSCSISLVDGTMSDIDLDVSGTSSQVLRKTISSLVPKDIILFSYDEGAGVDTSSTKLENTYYIVTCDPIVVNEIINTESKWLAKEFYTKEPISYTGTMELALENATIDNGSYNIYRLITSGELSLKKNSKVWMCGGGGSGDGINVTSTYIYAGNGGWGGKIYSGDIEKGGYTVQIGQVQGTTKISNSKVNLSCNGGTSSSGNTPGGGGAKVNLSSFTGISGSKFTGGGVTTRPFGISSLYYHAAGGGGGGSLYVYYTDSTNSTTANAYQRGRAGGSNGFSVDELGGVTSGSYSGGLGGEYAGGNGGPFSASAAFYYGSGGGGYGIIKTAAGSLNTTNKGYSGYQGVCYIAVPID